MSKDKEAVKLDEVMKFLFSTSNYVLLNLLNGIFDEEYKEDDVQITVLNNEFITDNFEVLRGDVFFKVTDELNEKINYHLEFQTKNDNTMVIRMFEYGLFKGKEERINSKDLKTLIFPKQKVIFIEENNKIPDKLEMNIIFSEGKEFTYEVGVIKYWEYSERDLISKKLYPLLPLQLFNLRKEINKFYKKNDIKKLQELSLKAKSIAIDIANESMELFEKNKILGEDFHKMLLAIQNLIEYLNRTYFKDDTIEEEVEIMTKTLYDPLVEERGIQKGIQKGIQEGIQKEKIELAINLLDVLDDEIIAEKVGLPLTKIREFRRDKLNKLN